MFSEGHTSQSIQTNGAVDFVVGIAIVMDLALGLGGYRVKEVLVCLGLELDI